MTSHIATTFRIRLTVIAMLLAGCTGTGVDSVRHTRASMAAGDTATGANNASLFDIVGNGFGSEPGMVTLGGVQLEVILWDSQRVRARLVEGATSGQLALTLADGETISGPKLLIDQGAQPIDSEFQIYLEQYAVTEGLGDAWLQWFLDPVAPYAPNATQTNSDHFRTAYQRQLLESAPITVAYRYYDTPYARLQDYPLPEGIDPDSLTEEEYEQLQQLLHAAAVKNYLEAVFQGRDFEVLPDGDTHLSDLVVYANTPKAVMEQPDGEMPSGTHSLLFEPTATGLVDDPGWWIHTIYAHNDGVLAHEVGHFLGLQHHYGEFNGVDLGKGLWMPPGETDCVMNQTGLGYCSACAAAAALEAPDLPAAAAALEQLQLHIDYPTD